MGLGAEGSHGMGGAEVTPRGGGKHRYRYGGAARLVAVLCCALRVSVCVAATHLQRTFICTLGASPARRADVM